jgi:hypothetical protein
MVALTCKRWILAAVAITASATVLHAALPAKVWTDAMARHKP